MVKFLVAYEYRGWVRQAYKLKKAQYQLHVRKYKQVAEGILQVAEVGPRLKSNYLIWRIRFCFREESSHRFFYGERIWFSSKVFPFVRVVFVVIELLTLISITDVTVSL